VVGNTGFWLAGGSLLLGAGGSPTTGSVTTDTLSFPTTSHVTTKHALGSASKPVTSEKASATYEIAGQVTQDGRTWTDALNQKLQFGDDQSSINPTCSGPCYQWVHGEETQSTSESASGPGVDVTRDDNSSWTIDAPNAFLQNKTGSAFFLPASVNQQLTDVASQQEGHFPADQTSLSESIIGYGALEENATGAPIVDGDTTGTITAEESGLWPGGNELYQRTLVARGGVVVQDLIQPTCTHLGCTPG
ncbi:MAG TPA: hypothetical protein VK784_10115, partial [Pseudonocardiaceae bacterium]|nr:hypothetical protein [Pseudonocardiaceae bacterium]